MVGTLVAVVVGWVLSLVSGFAAVMWQARASVRQELRRRSDDAARAALDAVEGLDRVRRGANLAGTQAARSGWDFEDGLAEFRRSTILISDPVLQARLGFVGEAWEEIDSAVDPGYEYQIRWGLVRFARDCLAAHLRGEPLPDEPERIREYRSVVEELRFLRDDAAQAELAHREQARGGP